MLALVSPINQGKPTMAKSKGFVLQHQSIDDQPWSNDPYCMLVAQFLIRKCSYKPHAISYGKHDIDLGIGEFVTTSLKLSKMCAVYGLYISSKNPDEAAKSAIKRVFKILEDDGFLSTKVIGKGKDQCTVISLKNWSKYQSKNVSVLKPITEPLEKPLEKPLESHIQQGAEGNSKPIENPNLKPMANPNNNKGSKQQERDVSKDTCDQSSSESPKKEDRTPYLKIIELYHEILPNHQHIRVFDSHKPNIRARHKSMSDGLNSWVKYFTFVAENCKWMVTGSYPSAEKFGYLINKSNFEDIQNGGKNDRF